MNGSMILRPWAVARARGRTGLAVLLFFMQLSLVFWPAAVRAAQRFQLELQKQALLDQLAAMHAPILAEKPASLGFRTMENAQ
jgi:hypothetical protein